MHKYYRTKSIEESVEWAKKVQVKKAGYVLWGRQYDTLNDIAKAFGLNTGSLRVRVAGGKALAATVSEMLEKDTILFRGREYAGIASLAAAYGHDSALISDRLIYGMTLERALSQPIRRIDRPEFAIEYDGKMYASKRQLCREIGISTGCIHEMMVNNDLDFETAVDILLETKDRIGIPREKMISGLPVCIIDGRTYRTVQEVACEFHLSTNAIASYKNKNGYTGMLETLCAMQKETKECYVVNGEAKTCNELLKMGYTSSSYRQVPKKRIPRYPQLAGKDFVNNCVDAMKIYREVKEERMEQEQGIQPMM